MKEPNHDITPQEQMAEAMQAERPGEAQPAAPKEEKPSLWIECYTLLHDLVYILVFVTILFVFALRVVSVSGPSMYPTLVDRDYVALLSNVFYSGSDIQNGDVVVALAPRFDDEPIVKRVIATAGQTVDIDFTRGIVYVDGAALDEPYINEPTHLQFDSRGVTFPLTVEEGQAVAALRNTSAAELRPGLDYTQRFVRGDESRTTEGSGLGLSLSLIHI